MITFGRVTEETKQNPPGAVQESSGVFGKIR